MYIDFLNKPHQFSLKWHFPLTGSARSRRNQQMLHILSLLILSQCYSTTLILMHQLFTEIIITKPFVTHMFLPRTGNQKLRINCKGYKEVCGHFPREPPRIAPTWGLMASFRASQMPRQVVKPSFLTRGQEKRLFRSSKVCMT